MNDIGTAILLLVLAMFSIIYGGFLVYGSANNTRRFREMPRKIDLMAFLGDMGRAIYLLIGVLLFCLGIFLLYVAFTDYI